MGIVLCKGGFLLENTDKIWDMNQIKKSGVITFEATIKRK